jgi:probable rRNA maturation factor
VSAVRRRTSKQSAVRRVRFTVVFVDRQRAHQPRQQRLRRILEAAARDLRAGGELAVVFTGDRAIRTLNAKYRKKDYATDVLSFPGEGGEEGLGDVVISIPAAKRNASELGRNLDEEIEILALHGLLHVLGHDHETDDGTMERIERRLRRRLLGAS